jgi:hypothetical protein
MDRLIAIEEIKLLKARYFRFVDSHDWAGLRTVFADDAVFGPERPAEPGSPRAPTSPIAKQFWETVRTEGGDAILHWISTSLADAASMHSGSMPEIEILTEDTARGLWAMEDIVRWPSLTIHGHGYYRETYVRRGGVWQIKSTELVRKSLKVEDLETTNSRIA